MAELLVSNLCGEEDSRWVQDERGPCRARADHRSAGQSQAESCAHPAPGARGHDVSNQ